MRTGKLTAASLALIAMALPAAALAADPSPAPSAYVCAEETTGCTGPLATGEHATVNFDVPFTFSVADDQWSNVIDRYRASGLLSSKAPEAEFTI